MSDYDHEIHDTRILWAAESLCRYSGKPYYLAFADVLEALAEINDDLYHMRNINCIENQIQKAQIALERILENARGRK